METKEIDENKLSKLYPQLDGLTPDEKWKAIDYLVASLVADTNKAISIVWINDQKINKEVVQKAEKLTEIISESQVTNDKNTEIKETDEHIEKLTAEDCTVYIHWNPKWYQVVWEQDRRKGNDSLLHTFDQYNFDRKSYDPEKVQILARDLWNLLTEYTIKKPSYEADVQRGWWYIWLTIILKNWYKIKDTWKLPLQGISKNYDWNTTEVEDLMGKFMEYLIKNCNLINLNDFSSKIKRAKVDEESIRKAVFKLKDVFIKSMNDNEENKGVIIKSNDTV